MCLIWVLLLSFRFSLILSGCLLVLRYTSLAWGSSIWLIALDLVRFPVCYLGSSPVPLSISVLLDCLWLWIPPEYRPAISTTREGSVGVLTIARAHEATGKIVLLIFCVLCGFQSRLRKKTERRLFRLSGLKNGKAKQLGGRAQGPSHPRGGCHPKTQVPEHTPRLPARTSLT